MAVEYAHRHLGEVGVAWQFPAEDATVLAAGFAELAAQLGAGGAAGGGDPVAAVHAVLAAYPGEWLLIFDNAPDQASVQAFLPPAGNGRVLITSQNALWPPGQAVEVPVLDTEVAAGFLVNRTGDPDSQAAAGAGRASWAGCRWRWSRPPPTSRPPGPAWPGTWRCSGSGGRTCWPAAKPAGHPADVAATWALALSRLEAEAPAAAGLLRLLACLAPEPVPLRLLLADAQTRRRA